MKTAKLNIHDLYTEMFFENELKELLKHDGETVIITNIEVENDKNDKDKNYYNILTEDHDDFYAISGLHLNF